MDFLNPIYSEQTECQDCYKCVRECPVKAIEVAGGHARVMSSFCIVCGHCVEVCPSGAKRVRDDLKRVQLLLMRKRDVYVSLAPSFVSEFQGISPAQLIHALKILGFKGVSETALGAQQVSAGIAETLSHQKNGILLSSACPVAVEYVMKYLPTESANVTQMLSPLLAHCRYLRNTCGSNIGIVFIGPCIAKKLEAQSHPELLDASLTFEDLRRWLNNEGISLSSLKSDSTDVFVPEAAKEGAIYPIEGGMSRTVEMSCLNNSVHYASVSGIRNIHQALDELDRVSGKENLFLELLACEGGCVNGPKTEKRSPILSRLDVLDHAGDFQLSSPRKPIVNLEDLLSMESIPEPVFDDEQIRKTLLKIGKQSEKDELNCGGCGYDSCRDFAKAILSGKAETRMCVSYMRNLAQRKANALLRTMPYAGVIVDENLQILECNPQFAKVFGEELTFQAVPGLAGASLSVIVPFWELFKTVLETDKELTRRNLRYGNQLLDVSIFTIEPNHVIGAILLDVTQTEMRREQIVEKAQQVIQNTLATAQDIAFRMGQNAAESELILNSIIEGFTANETKDPQE